jgi:hypothetical protein
MARATFHKVADGYRARDSAAWTEEKLMILDAYLKAFAKACAKAGGWYGLDLFAGTGLNWSTTRDKEINGSALLALEAGSPEATKVIVAEQHAGSLPCSSNARSAMAIELRGSTPTPTRSSRACSRSSLAGLRHLRFWTLRDRNWRERRLKLSPLTSVATARTRLSS